MDIVIPMAGKGSRFVDGGYANPKPFIDVMGKTMIENVLTNLKVESARFILIARKEHIEDYPEVIKEIQDKYNVVFLPIDITTEGAACTVLFAREFIDSNNPLIIANSDQIVDIDVQNFVSDCLGRNLDGSILTFKDPYKSNKWSFAKTDKSGLVTEVKEKEAISDIATVGIYMFKKGKYFVDNALDMIVRNDRVNNEFYVCPVYNYAIRNNKKIGIYNIPFDTMHGIGTPEDLKKFINKIS
ncbi:glycosyltransferase family 2 protein [Candidatus Marinimicrobia bacterium]|nr:glycosyltransferase family 2 protein [Candidatus Neomarinimicrobiota bacterium]